MNKRTYNLTETRLLHLRRLWENDPRNSFCWLIEKKGIKRYVKAEELKQIAAEQGWTKQVRATDKTSKETPTIRQKKFIKALGMMSDNQAKKAAGYSDKSPSTTLKKNKIVQKLLKDQADEDLKKLGITREFLIKVLALIVFYDFTNIVQVRRSPCPYCYGNSDTAPTDKDTSKPNPDCPNCHGEGIVNIHYADTRELDAVGKLIFKGVENTPSGIKVHLFDKEKALDMLCRALRIYDEDDKTKGNTFPCSEELAEKFARIMEASRERQRKLEEERGPMLAEADARAHGRDYP